MQQSMMPLTPRWDYMEKFLMALRRLLTMLLMPPYNTLWKKDRNRCGTSSLDRNTRSIAVSNSEPRPEFLVREFSLSAAFNIVSTCKNSSYYHFAFDRCISVMSHFEMRVMSCLTWHLNVENRFRIGSGMTAKQLNPVNL